MAVAAARGIAAGGLAGDGLLARHQAGDHLDLHVLDGFFLGLGEAANVVPGEADVVLELRRDLGRRRVDLVAGQDDVPVVAVEFGSVAPGRLVTAGFDLVEDRLHGGTHITGIVGRLSGGLLKVLDGHGFLICRYRGAVL